MLTTKGSSQSVQRHRDLSTRHRDLSTAVFIPPSLAMMRHCVTMRRRQQRRPAVAVAAQSCNVHLHKSKEWSIEAQHGIGACTVMVSQTNVTCAWRVIDNIPPANQGKRRKSELNGNAPQYSDAPRSVQLINMNIDFVQHRRGLNLQVATLRLRKKQKVNFNEKKMSL